MNNVLKSILLNINSSSLGGEINFDATENPNDPNSKSGTNFCVLNFWDGRRFLLTCVEENSNGGYDPNSGDPIP